MLSKESDITGMEHLRDIAIAIAKVIAWVTAKRWKIVRRTQGASSTQTFPLHKTHFLLNRFKDPSSFESGKRHSASRSSTNWQSQCSGKQLAQFYKRTHETLLVVEYAAVRVLIKKSDILNPISRSRVFTASQSTSGVSLSPTMGH